MASLTPHEQLEHVLHSMVAEGIVNNEFLQLQNMKVNQRDYVIGAVIAYWNVVKQLFTQMSHQLDMNSVDFYEILRCAHNLLERSNSFGAVHVSTTCNDILRGCHDQDIDCCKQGLLMAKRNFARLEAKLQSVVKLERNIIEYDDMQNGGGQN